MAGSAAASWSVLLGPSNWLPGRQSGRKRPWRMASKTFFYSTGGRDQDLPVVGLDAPRALLHMMAEEAAVVQGNITHARPSQAGGLEAGPSPTRRPGELEVERLRGSLSCGHCGRGALFRGQARCGR